MSAATPRSVMRRIAGWGNFPVEECALYRPDRIAELSEIVARAPHPHLIARGLGRSYGDAALNRDSGVVLSERRDRILEFDPETGSVWCEAAVSLAELMDVFLPRGFLFPVTPGTKFVTVGGAIAADVHGKNHHCDGSISEYLLELNLLTASGEVLRCSRDRHSDVFWATVGGMGLTGIVLDARLRLRPVDNAWMTVDYDKGPDLDSVLEKFLRSDADYQYSVAWIDCLARGKHLGRSVLMRANHARDAELPARARGDLGKAGGRTLSLPFHLPNASLNRFTMQAFNTAYYHTHRRGRVTRPYESYQYPLDSIHHWNRGYGRRGVVQYQAVIPPESGRAGLVALLEEVSSAKLPSFLSVLKPFGAAGPGLLSFPRPGHTLSLDLPNLGPPLLEVVARLDAIVLRHGGSVYLAKDSCLPPEALPQMYPKLEQFREIKAKVDPNNRFSSSLSRRLRIVEEA